MITYCASIRCADSVKYGRCCLVFSKGLVRSSGYTFNFFYFNFDAELWSRASFVFAFMSVRNAFAFQKQRLWGGWMYVYFDFAFHLGKLLAGLVGKIYAYFQAQRLNV